MRISDRAGSGSGTGYVTTSTHPSPSLAQRRCWQLQYLLAKHHRWEVHSGYLCTSITPATYLSLHPDECVVVLLSPGSRTPTSDLFLPVTCDLPDPVHIQAEGRWSRPPPPCRSPRPGKLVAQSITWLTWSSQIFGSGPDSRVQRGFRLRFRESHGL